jgi:hypothetical protein
VTVTISIIGERALRRLGVAVVSVADRPALNTRVAPTDIATGALIELGVIATGQVPPTQATIVTLDSVATNGLVKLGVVASDETPNTNDMSLARAAVTAVHNSLVAQGTVDWTSAAITTAVSEEYAGLAAAHMASSFGKASDPAMVPMLEGRIAAVSRVIRAQALALSKLTQVQASLVSQANVSWDNLGVPTAVAEEYTRLTAMALAPSFGKQVDPQVLSVMEARVRRMAAVLAGPASANDAVQAVHDALVARGLARWSVFDLPVACELPYEMLAANRLAPLFDKQADPNDDVLATRALLQIIALPTSGLTVRVAYY